MLNGHPWISYAEIGYHNTMKEMGFEVHDELFDMSFDNIECLISRAHGLVTMVNNLDYSYIKTQVTDFKSETRQKILHNQNMLLNKNSRLWQELEYVMLNYIRIFNEF